MYNPVYSIYRHKLQKDETEKESKKRFEQKQWIIFCNRIGGGHGIDLCRIRVENL